MLWKYPPSQISKNWIKRSILKVFREESDPALGWWFTVSNIRMHVCMYAKLVCMYVRASGSTPPHKSQKIELNVQYWRFSVRNRTQPWDDDLRSQTYIHAWRHTYMLRHLRHTYDTYICMPEHVCMYVCWACMYVRASGSTPPHDSKKKQLNVQICMVFVRNWTQSWDDDLWSQTYIHDLRHTYIQTYIHDLTPQTYIHTWLSGASRSTPPHKSQKN